MPTAGSVETVAVGRAGRIGASSRLKSGGVMLAPMVGSDFCADGGEHKEIVIFYGLRAQVRWSRQNLVSREESTPAAEERLRRGENV